MEIWERLTFRSRIVVFLVFVVAVAVDYVLGQPTVSPEIAYVAVASWVAPRMFPDQPIQDVLERAADRVNAALEPKRRRA
jgi:hypothetical protein